jgi:cardiolipin synthase A/B
VNAVFRFRHASLFALLHACILLSVGCASLPEVNADAVTQSAPERPRVVNASGELPAARSGALLRQRWRNSHTDLAALAAIEEAATGQPLIAGNKVSLLYDGPQTMRAMMAAISAAKDHINLETYIFDEDELGMKFADLLIARQRAGVQVNIIYDSVGGMSTSREFFARMREAGIQLTEFNPVNPLSVRVGWRPNNRDHRKLLVVDGRVAFTGGINISAAYSTGSMFRSKTRQSTKVGWRDTHVQIEGPAVRALQWSFLQHWAAQRSPELADSDFFPRLPNAGTKLVRVLASDAGANPNIYRAYLLAIQEAQKTIHITNAYFVPDQQILSALCNAAQRKVDVKLILPGESDVGIIVHATHSYYQEMLGCGIQIHQLKTAVLHAKTAVIDGHWSTVGSSNIDTRSFLHNSELNVVVFDQEFGAAMENAFTEDLRQSTPITKDEWEQRPRTDKIKEWMARRLAYWL